MAAGCSTGAQGVAQVEKGNYTAADASFTKEYAEKPNNPIAQFNMADTHQRHGNTAAANSLYHEVAETGQNVRPGKLLEPHAPGATMADAACQHLRENGQSDPNCPI
ncbi:MAG TPA: hypothetical protein VHL34_02840 [Rhizomicrobium sp.]|jgi:thioredoxin-like negative regulator of GroEL|nr:hypothetical protein [Rhizomicrobium sp.]